MAERERRELFCLMVTEEERNVIEGIFAFHGWDIIRASQDDHGPITIPSSCPEQQSLAVQCENSANSGHLDTNLQEQITAGGLGHQDPGSSGTIRDPRECIHCFCSPCITDLVNKQMWWPNENAIAHSQNRGIRNTVYKKFWSMMHNRHMWSEPRYLERKKTALQRDLRMKHFKWHKREIMPNCILETVRNWFPKTENEEYVGHHWG